MCWEHRKADSDIVCYKAVYKQGNPCLSEYYNFMYELGVECHCKLEINKISSYAS